MPFELAWRFLKSRQTTLPSFDPAQVQEVLDPERRSVVIAAPPGAERMTRPQAEARSNELLQALAEAGVGSIHSTEGSGEWGQEPGFTVSDVREDDMDTLRAIARRFGQEAIAVSEGGRPRFENPHTGETTMQFTGSRFHPEAEHYTQFGTGDKWAFT